MGPSGPLFEDYIMNSEPSSDNVWVERKSLEAQLKSLEETAEDIRTDLAFAKSNLSPNRITDLEDFLKQLEEDINMVIEQLRKLE